MDDSVASVHKGIASITEALEEGKRVYASQFADVQLLRKRRFQLTQAAGLAVIGAATVALKYHQEVEERQRRRRDRKRTFRKKLESRQVDRFKKAVVQKQG